MATRAQKIRLGLFMLLSFILFFGSIGILAGMRLWNPRDVYRVNYTESISGLEVGAAVKMKGVRVGRVETIAVSEDAESVVVTLALKPNTPVTIDTKAVVTAIGITGLKFIELTGGRAKSERIKPNLSTSTIKSGESMLQSLTGKASDIATKMEAVLNHSLAFLNESNRVRLEKLLDNTNRLVVAYADIGEKNKAKIGRILASVDRTSRTVDKTAQEGHRLVKEIAPTIKRTFVAAQNAANTVSHTMESLRPQSTLNAITKTATAIRKRIDDPRITNALKALSDAGEMVSVFSKEAITLVGRSNRRVSKILANLAETSRNFKELSRSLRERPSLLLGGKTLKERKIK